MSSAIDTDPGTGPTTDPTTGPTTGPVIGPLHQRRLRAMWRSAGWPFHDLIEIDLLAAGLLLRERDAAGHETLRVSDAGIQALARTLQRNRDARAGHETLVARVTREMLGAGRVVWRGLSLRARLGAGDDAAAETAASWAVVMPDVYSIRHTSREDDVEPVVHEIKVRRSDLLADLRRPAKGEAYRWLSGECWYVIREGIAQPQEIPEVYGVMLALPGGGLSVARPAPKRRLRLPFVVWMALARATPEKRDEEAQGLLGETGNGAEGG
jgi:hypothetical protein